MILRVRAFLVRYQLGILIGILGGLLLSNIWLNYHQKRTSDALYGVTTKIQEQIEVDNKSREEARKDSEARTTIIINYLKCIALIHPEDRTPAKVQNCVDNSGFVDTSPLTSVQELSTLSQDAAVVPQSTTPQPESPPPAGENRPPEKQPTFIERTTDALESLIGRIF